MMYDLQELFSIHRFEMVDAHIKNISSVNPNEKRYVTTVLHQYVQNRDFDRETMLSLLNRGADLKMRNKMGKTAFLLAVVHRQKEMIEMLIDHGADVTDRDYVGNSALHYMAHPELNRYWKCASSNSNNREEKFNFDNTYEILKILLNKKVDVNIMNEDYETPLMWASRGLDLQIVKMLLESGADVHLQDIKLRTSLHFATSVKVDFKEWEKINLAIISELILNKSCINCLDKFGRTALGNIFLPGNANNVYLAKEVIKVAAIVNWRERIEFCLSSDSLSGTLEQYFSLLPHVNFCYSEIDSLKYYLLPGGFNLCHFVAREVPEASQNSMHDIALKILLSVSFPIYHYLIVSSFQKSYLRQKVSELTNYARGERKNVELNKDVILHLSSFLENNDIFNLIHAFPNSNDPKAKIQAK